MIYFKEISFVKIWMLLYFGIFNLFLIDDLYLRYEIVQKTFLGITLNGLVGLIFIFYLFSKIIGFKKKEVKKK